MTTPQLLDFVRKSLSQGVTKEKITSDLIANGWTPTDIQECFRSLSINTPPANLVPVFSNFYPNSDVVTTPVAGSHKGRRTFFAISLIILIGGGTSGYYFKDNILAMPIVKDFISSKNINADSLTEEQALQKKAIQDKILQDQIEKSKLEASANLGQKQATAASATPVTTSLFKTGTTTEKSIPVQN